jgi:hypothetical protein
VVAVLVGVLSIAQGIRLMVQSSADADNAIVLRSGSDSEMMSGLGGTQAEVIGDAPGLARTEELGALASPELFVIINLPKTVHRDRRQRPTARRIAGRLRHPLEPAHRRGTAVRVGAQRTRGRRGCCP